MKIRLYKSIASLGAWIRTQEHKSRHYKSRCYLSGAISSIDLQEAYENFARAEQRLKSTYIVVNPLTIHPDNLTWVQYMVLDVWELLFCKTAYFQSNWKLSRGARIEYFISKLLNKHVIFES